MKELLMMTKKGWLKYMVYYLILSFAIISIIPHPSFASVVPEKIKLNPDREQDLLKIRAMLERKEVSQRLKDFGLTTQEVEKRLSLLSDEEVHKLAVNIDKLNPAGGPVEFVIGIAIIVVVVLLILDLTGVYDVNWKFWEKEGKKKEPK